MYWTEHQVLAITSRRPKPGRAPSMGALFTRAALQDANKARRWWFPRRRRRNGRQRSREAGIPTGLKKTGREARKQEEKCTPSRACSGQATNPVEVLSDNEGKSEADSETAEKSSAQPATETKAPTDDKIK
ncbi:hypothetical protein PybrP1_005062 [[Pythium] brassicae (nom. inval.)]|nr:hypothetical protein PybrP1_005062 [[Pythium] brassicae (nom. inval.)]